MNVVTDQEFAWRFASDWVDAWNAHDLERVLSHYTDDFEMSSPFIVSMSGNAEGRLKGKANVGAYWRTALEKFPDLHFDLVDVLYGTQSVVIYYKSVLGKQAAEIFFFNAAGQVCQALAHYDS